jgi:hypothetical protein
MRSHPHLQIAGYVTLLALLLEQSGVSRGENYWGESTIFSKLFENFRNLASKKKQFSIIGRGSSPRP